jgi:UDP-glucose 4-epimerase
VYGHRWAVKWGPLVEGDLANPEQIERALAELGWTPKYPAIDVIVEHAHRWHTRSR